jgi:predicted DNA-binding antitoxin AbrB/MazE fold protein
VIYPGTFRNGAVVFDQPVDLPEGARVEVNVIVTSLPEDPDMSKIYEILDARFDSGFTDTAERHNEHQP